MTPAEYITTTPNRFYPELVTKLALWEFDLPQDEDDELFETLLWTVGLAPTLAPGPGPAGSPSDLPGRHSQRTAGSLGKNNPGWHPYLSDGGSFPPLGRGPDSSGAIHLTDTDNIHHQLDFPASTTSRSPRFYFDVKVVHRPYHKGAVIQHL